MFSFILHGWFGHLKTLKRKLIRYRESSQIRLMVGLLLVSKSYTVVDVLLYICYSLVFALCPAMLSYMASRGAPVSLTF